MIKRYKKSLIFVIFFGGIFLSRVFYITRIYGPIVYTDEIGYWGHAANLTGNTWAGVMNNLPWYGFGYSLLLAPVFQLSHNMIVMYRAAIILNALMGLCSFVLAYKIIKKTSDVSDIIAGLFAFISVSYSAYIFYSHIAWGETLLALLIWLILYETVTFEDAPTFLKGFLLGITTGFGYVVHNRMLAVIGAVFFVVLFLWWLKRIKSQHLFGVFLGVLFVFGLSIILKRYLQDCLLHNEVAEKLGIELAFSSANTMSAQLHKLEQFFSLDGIKRVFLNFIGQIWQILSATYFVAGIGVLYCIRSLKAAYGRKERMGLYILPIAMLLFTMLMTSYFFIGEGSPIAGSVRIDSLFYARYNETLTGPLVMWGLLYLSKFKTSCRKDLIWIAAIYLLTGFMVYWRIKDITDYGMNIVSMPSTYTFHWLGEFAVWKCSVIAMIVIAVIIFLNRWDMPHHIEKYLICGILLGLFFFTALKCMKLVIRGENDNTLQYSAIYSYLSENTQEKELIYTFEQDKFAYDIQTRVVDRPVVILPPQKCDLVDSGHYLVVKEADYEHLNPSDWTVDLIHNGYMILKKAGD